MGYYQVHIAREYIPYTSFVLGKDQYAFCRMPFGLCNAPKTFTRIVNKMFDNMKCVTTYLDDILIASSSYEEHVADLSKVFAILHSYGASITFKKSKFGLRKVTYFGQIISESGIKPDLARIETFKLNPSKTQKQVMKIVGLLNRFWPFIPNAPAKLKGLTDKLQATEKQTKWTEDDTLRLNEIVEEIKQQTLLRHPNFDKPFVLKTDASDFAIGAVLLQQDGPIGFSSKKLTTVQQKYSIVEKELFGILATLEHFKTILFDSEITVLSDNKNLTFFT